MAEKAYLSVTGDPAPQALAWRKRDEVWWPGGPSDPSVCILVVRPKTAELRDGSSSSAVAAYEFAKAWATGTEPNLGENRKITVEMKP